MFLQARKIILLYFEFTFLIKLSKYPVGSKRPESIDDDSVAGGSKRSKRMPTKKPRYKYLR